MGWRGGAVVFLIAVVAWPGGVVAAGARTPSSVLLEATTGEILSATDPDRAVPVGSLYQLMILLLSLEQSELGTLRLNVPVTVSAAPRPAARRADMRSRVEAASALPLRAERTYLLSDLLKAVAVSGADDAAVAIAEAIAGSLSGCLESMNARAERLGMTATHFGTLAAFQADPRAEDRTTARDMARLAHVLAGYPMVLEWTSLSGLPFADGAALLRNTNPLIGLVAGVDGMHVGRAALPRQAASSVVLTALRHGLRLIAVNLDAGDSAAQFRTAVDSLEWGFANYERVELVKQGESLNFSVEIDGGAHADVTPLAGETFAVVRHRDEERNFQLRYQLPSMLTAPIERQQQIGEIIVEERGSLLAVIPAVSPVSVPAVGVLSAALR
jgi:D-alanyl-D-alanine carboxypeptidase (penicillin-binding protein 5/6)